MAMSFMMLFMKRRPQHPVSLQLNLLASTRDAFARIH